MKLDRETWVEHPASPHPKNLGWCWSSGTCFGHAMGNGEGPGDRCKTPCLPTPQGGRVVLVLSQTALRTGDIYNQVNQREKSQNALSPRAPKHWVASQIE